MTQILSTDDSLFNDKYKSEIYKYKNNYRADKIKEQIKSLRTSLKFFKYVSDELISEIEKMYDFVIIYYAKEILFLVDKYQNHNFDKDILKNVYIYLKEKCIDDNEILLSLDNDYNNFICRNIQNEYVNDVEFKKFIYHVGKIYDAEKIILTIKEKNLYNIICKYINNKNINKLFDLCFNESLCELFIFIYLFMKVKFNYAKFNENNIIKPTQIFSDKVAAESNSTNETCSFFMVGSKEKNKIFKIMSYLKKYSKRQSVNLYTFNIKYISLLSCFETNNNNNDEFEKIINFINNYI
jgi:hypothetical protein